MKVQSAEQVRLKLPVKFSEILEKNIVTLKGKTVPAKTFMFQNCSCRNDCNKLDYAMRHDIHNQF